MPLTFQRSRYPVVQRIEQNEIIVLAIRSDCTTVINGKKVYCIVDSATVPMLDREVPKGECLWCKESRQSNKMNKKTPDDDDDDCCGAFKWKLNYRNFVMRTSVTIEVSNHRQMSYLYILLFPRYIHNFFLPFFDVVSSAE